MPISRPLLIALIAAVVAALGFFATQGSRQSTSASSPETVAAPPPAESPAKAKSEPAKSAPADKADLAKAARTTERAQRESAPAKPRVAGVPLPVQRALDARRQIVLFFYRPGAADDRATARGVAALRGKGGTVVITAPIGRLASYRGLVGELGITQAPAVVIVSKDRSARVVEGYVDPATLAQDVADAR
jgi:hypothetical protein